MGYVLEVENADAGSTELAMKGKDRRASASVRLSWPWSTIRIEGPQSDKFQPLRSWRRQLPVSNRVCT